MEVILVIFVILIPISFLYTFWRESVNREETIREMAESKKETERVLRNWYTVPQKDEEYGDGSCFHQLGGPCQGCREKYGKV